MVAISTWEFVTVEPHRFGGQEFKLENIEIGHVHNNGMVDIPFTRAIREQIIVEELAEAHHILPESGWISFYIRQSNDVDRAIWLLRLSYLQKRLNRSRRNPEERTRLLTEMDVLQPSAKLLNLIG